MVAVLDRLSATDRRIVTLAIPALGALAVEPLYVLSDTAIVGRLGTAQLGGLALAATVLSFVIAGSNFLTYGTTERIARRLGAGDKAAAADVGVQALWLAALVGLPITGLLLAVARPACRALGGSGDVLEYAVTYLRISAVGVPFVLIALAAQGVHRGAADYHVPLRVLLTANLANVVMEIVFVFGLDLGIPGSAWSTVIAQAGAAVAFGFTVRRHLVGATTRRPHLAGLAPLMAAGRHLLLRVFGILAVLAGATSVAARVDAPTLAAHQVVANVLVFLALALDAVAVPAQTLVADAVGSGDRAEARRIAERVVRLSIYCGLALMAVVALLAPLLARVFSADGAVVARATTGLWWMAASLVPAAIAFGHDGVLIGLADYRFLGRAAAVYAVAVAPMALLVLAAPSLGIAGIWLGIGVWMVLRASVNHRRTATLLVT